jgi:F-type H+-transporting ATPase subunit gamma
VSNPKSHNETPLITVIANFSAFEIDDEVLTNMREYALANSLFWALAEGHACEQSARRNAMDVSVKAVPLTIAY